MSCSCWCSRPAKGLPCCCGCVAKLNLGCQSSMQTGFRCLWQDMQFGCPGNRLLAATACLVAGGQLSNGHEGLDAAPPAPWAVAEKYSYQPAVSDSQCPSMHVEGCELSAADITSASGTASPCACLPPQQGAAVPLQYGPGQLPLCRASLRHPPTRPHPDPASASGAPLSSRQWLPLLETAASIGPNMRAGGCKESRPHSKLTLQTAIPTAGDDVTWYRLLL